MWLAWWRCSTVFDSGNKQPQLILYCRAKKTSWYSSALAAWHPKEVIVGNFLICNGTATLDIAPERSMWQPTVARCTKSSEHGVAYISTRTLSNVYVDLQ